MRAIRHIVLHCSATPNGDGRFTRERIRQMHLEQGWQDIGYHFVIEVGGAIRKGRPEAQAGSHVRLHNHDSIAVCMVGTDRFDAAQWEALRDLVDLLQSRYLGATVWGHRDFSPDRNGDGVIDTWEHFKLCPGFDVKEWLISGMEPHWNMAHLQPGPNGSYA